MPKKGESESGELGSDSGQPPGWTVVVKSKAAKAIQKLQRKDREALLSAMATMEATGPRQPNAHRLQGREDWRWAVQYRLRIVYHFDETTITVTYAGTKEGVPY